MGTKNVLRLSKVNPASGIMVSKALTSQYTNGQHPCGSQTTGHGLRGGAMGPPLGMDGL